MKHKHGRFERVGSASAVPVLVIVRTSFLSSISLIFYIYVAIFQNAEASIRRTAGALGIQQEAHWD